MDSRTTQLSKSNWISKYYSQKNSVKAVKQIVWHNW